MNISASKQTNNDSPCGCPHEFYGGRRQSTDLWGVRFQIAQPMESFPQIQGIRAEHRQGAAYHYEGRFRSSEKHCVFKYTLSGEGRFQCGRKKYPLPAGCGFLCEISDPATSYYYPDDGTIPWEFVYITFAGPAATVMTREFVRRHGYVYRLPQDIGFIQEIMEWQGYDRQEVRIAPAEGARIIASLFAALSQSKVKIDESDAGFLLVRQTRQLMRRNLHQFCNVKTISAQLGVSREHLSRVFKEQTGKSPYRYLQRQKMIEACRLLKETRLAQKEIAVRMGYDEPAHFTRAFLRIMHMTPRRFRTVGMVPTQ